MKPTIVQCDGFRLVIGQCSHDNASMTIGPTTDQRNHYCPDCGSLWTTWPTDEERRAALDAAIAGVIGRDGQTFSSQPPMNSPRS